MRPAYIAFEYISAFHPGLFAHGPDEKLGLLGFFCGFNIITYSIK